MRRFALAALLLGALAHSADAQSDDLWVVNSGNGNILRITAAGNITTFVPRLNNPLAIARDAQGNFFVSCTNLNANTPTFNVGYGGSGAAASMVICKVDNNGKAAIFATVPTSSPGWLAFDHKGTLFVGSGPGQLYKVSPAGAVAKVELHFPLTTSYIPSLCGVAFDAHGNLFASDGRSTIYKINPATGDIAPFASGLDEPTGLAFDDAGNLYAAANANSTVVRVSTTGVVSLFARVPDPAGLAFDAKGNLFVASLGTDTIFKVDKTGAVNGFVRGSGLDIPAGLAFNRPLFHATPAPGSATDNQSSLGLMLAFCAPAVILVFGLLLWLVFRKKEEE